ncbi:MAG: glycosyltransferase family 4 protein [Sphingomonadales bacterium]|nr:glycosyltransferase family 4 protein [Sphingomonadales bacterium]
MKVAVVHPGTQHSWQTALALQELGALHFYATSIFHQPGRFPYSLADRLPGAAGARLAREFARFSHPGLDPALVRTAGLSEWAERLAARAGARRLAQRIDRLGNRRFARSIAAELASAAPFALWAYNASARESFLAARAAGRLCILDRTIGDLRAYDAAMDVIAARHGDWILPGDRRIAPEVIARDEAEYALADRILVGCEHAAGTIRAHAAPAIADKLEVLPYCWDEALFGAMPPPAPAAVDEPLRLLFVGQAHARKGIHLLLEAFAKLPPGLATLTVVGDIRVPRALFARHAAGVTHIAQVPRAEIPAIMARHHLLVFPSFFEGSALTLLEALAAGLAIIQTPAAGCGVTARCGLLLERPDGDLLFAALSEALRDRERLQHWREAAQVEARRYSFSRYRAGIDALLRRLAAR